MEFLQMSAMAFDHLPRNEILPSSECKFEVSVGGGNFQPVDRDGAAPATFPLPDSPRPLQITVHAKPTTPNFHEYFGKYEYRGPGNLVPVLAAPEFRPPRAFKSGSSDVVVSLVFYLSRVSDKTEEVVFNLAQTPASRKHDAAPGTLNDWSSPELSSLYYVSDPPLTNGQLNFEQRSINPNTEDLVLGVAGVKAPKLIAISWPNSMTRTLDSKPTAFFVYIHAGMAQNVNFDEPDKSSYIGPGLGTYPFGWDYLFYGLWRYMNYQGDPMTGADGVFTKGLPYQVEAAGKKIVIVLPGSTATGAEAGVFRDAESTQDLLREIDAFMYRRKGIYTPPGIGRTGLGSFSSGNDFVQLFLNDKDNQRHPFYLNILKELYGFEAPQKNDWVDAAIAWSTAGEWEDKVVQIYTQGVGKRYNEMLDEQMPKGPFIQSNGTGLYTVGVLPNALWTKLRAPLGVAQTLFQDVHQVISSTMLTQALRKSKF